MADWDVVSQQPIAQGAGPQTAASRRPGQVFTDATGKRFWVDGSGNPLPLSPEDHTPDTDATQSGPPRSPQSEVVAGRFPSTSSPGLTVHMAPTQNVPPPSTNSGSRVTRDSVVKFWMDKGAPEPVAEGIADSVQRESGFNSEAWNPDDMGSPSGGLYQDHAERLTRLQALPNWRDPMVQHENAYAEVTGGDPIASKHWQEILHAPDRATAQTLWDKYFERGVAQGPGKAPAWAVTQNGKWQVDQDALAAAQDKGDVVWMSPDDYLGMLSDGRSQPRRSLRKMLEEGNAVDEIPTLDVKAEDGRAKVVDQDGRGRALMAKENGVDLIPVSIQGLSGQSPRWIEGMNGVYRPLNFAPVPKVTKAPTVAERFGEGVRDVIGGGAQLLEHAVPKTISDSIDRLNNTLADAGVPLARIPEGGIDEMERDRAEKIDAERQARGESGTDWWREAGRDVGGAPVMAAAAEMIPASGIASALASGAVSGAAGGALEPATGPGNFWAQKAGQVGEGAVLGAGMGAAGNAAANLIKPAFRPAADLLLREGVRLTPGQMAGGAARRVEDALSSIPVLGQAVRAGVRRAIVDFNRAAWNRALAPLGKELPKNVEPGRDAVNYVDQEISRAYDAIIPHLTGYADQDFLNDLTPIFQRAASELPKAQRERFADIFNSQLIQKTLAPKTGEQLKGIDSMLGAEARGYRADPSYDNRKLGNIIADLHAAFRSALTRQNLQYAPALRAANEAYANFVRVAKAASSTGAKEGVFSPAQLRAAVRSSDPSLRKLDFGRGNALIQDLTDAAEAVLPRVVPDSGTPERLMTERALGIAGLGGAAAFEPNALAAGIAASAPYTSMGMSALQQWATALPKVRNALAQPVRQMIPYIAGGFGAASAAPRPVPGQ